MTRFTWLIPDADAPVGAPFPANLGFGNIGLVGPASVLLHFAEPTGVMPADDAGNLADLTAPTGLTAPTVVDAWTGSGRGRLFGSGKGLAAVDRAGRDTLSNRDVTVQAIVSVSRASLPVGGGTLYVRGLDGSTAERYSFGVDLTASGSVGVDVRAFWQDSAGVTHYQEAATYQHPGDSDFVLVTVTRRWESTTRAVVRYYFGEALLAEFVSTDGAIAGATIATTSIGARRTAGVWGSHFAGVVDELKVTAYEMSAEEVRATYRRLAVWQPAGVDMMTGLIPPGVSWTRDPGSRIGRLVRVAGQALGFAMATAEEFRVSWFPDSAYLDGVARWESIRHVSARPRDSLAARRARLASLSQRAAGYSLPAIKAALAPLFDLAPEDVEILEFDPEVRDDFATLSTQRWDLLPSAAWTLDAGTLRLQRAAGTSLAWDDAAHDAPMALASLSSGAGEIIVEGSFVVATWPYDVTVGVVLRKGLDASWFGILRDDDGDYVLEAVSVIDGFRTVEIISPSLAWTLTDPLRVRLVAEPSTPGRYRYDVLDVSGAVIIGGGAVDGLVFEPTSAGFGIVGLAPLVGGIDARFDDFLARTPQGERAFHWYAYRDPALPGSPDMAGARALVRKLKPAHTHGAAILQFNVLCDDPATGCDREPMGGV